MKRCWYLVFSIIGILLLVAGLVLIFAVIPPIIEGKVEEEIVLKNGTEQFDRFLKVPQPLFYKIYLFNVTNPEDVQMGKKPIVQEVGPYVYSMQNSKKDYTIHSNEEEIQFKVDLNIQFDAKASGTLKEDDVVQVLNVPMNAAILFVDGGPLAPAVSASINGIFNNPTSMFIKTTVRDFLFDGYRFCIKPKPHHNLVCTTINKQGSKTIRQDTDKSLLFSFFNHKNVSDDGLWNIYSGVKDILDIGQITSWNNETQMKLWKDVNSTCNKVQGTDSTIYRPFRQDKEDDYMWVFNSDICRAVSVHYKEKREFNDIETYRYEANDAFMKKPADCFCLNQTRGINDPKTGCLLEGALELYTCQKAHVVLTHPHFMFAHDKYKKSVEGLRPDPNTEEHGTFIEVEPYTGTPVKGSKRVQFNMFIRKVEGIKFTENLKTALVPIIWVDEGIELNQENIDLLNNSLFEKLLIADAVTWTMVGVGALLGAVGIIFWFCKKH